MNPSAEVGPERRANRAVEAAANPVGLPVRPRFLGRFTWARGAHALVVSGLVLAAGCASAPPTVAWRPMGDPVVGATTGLEQSLPRDRVLWQYRLAKAALDRGQLPAAKAALDDALARIGGIFSADAASRSARGYFTAEAKKTFLGEPYERVMAYYYRGILYWMDGEPDNARACFRSGQFHDADAEEKSYASDYVLLDYLDGLASMKLGGDGSDAIQRAKAAAHLAIPPDPQPRNNVLFFIDYGQGPSKFATGQYGEQLRFHEGQSPAREVMIRIGAQAAHVGPYDDLNFQATTRGGRAMDHILGNKAVFKGTTDAVGDAAIVSGAILAGAGAGSRSAADEVGLGLLAAGLVSKIVSAATTPQADTRCWENLPMLLTFASFALPPGQHTATVEFLDTGRRPIAGLTKTVTLTVPEGGRDKVIYLNDRSPTPQTL